MTAVPTVIGRRALLACGAGGLLLPALAPATAAASQNIDVAGSSPALRFTMTRASDGRVVTQAEYRGRVVLLYFGYTFCPDVCPLTLTNVAEVLKRLGKRAEHVRVLFVTVDPHRDTLPVLKQYVAAFAPQIVGLRGTADELAALARRYRIAYSVTSSGGTYEVTHSSAIYAFDGSGAARLLIPSLATQPPDIAGTTADLRRLVDETAPQGLLSHLLGVLSGLV